MSRSTVLELISKLERIADLLPESSSAEQNSLAGQAVGTVFTIKEAFARHGISIKNRYIYEQLDRMGNPRHAEEVVFALHTAAAYLRGLADDLPS